MSELERTLLHGLNSQLNFQAQKDYSLLLWLTEDKG